MIQPLCLAASIFCAKKLRGRIRFARDVIKGSKQRRRTTATRHELLSLQRTTRGSEITTWKANPADKKRRID